MQKAKIIDVYTSAGNVNFALNFQFQMQEIGRIVNVPIDEYQQRLIASSSNSDHQLIITGLQTNFCIDATIKSALDENFTVYVPTNCNSTFDEQVAHTRDFNRELATIFILINPAFSCCYRLHRV